LLYFASDFEELAAEAEAAEQVQRRNFAAC